MLSIRSRNPSISLSVKAAVEFCNVLRFVMELMYNERASAITVELVVLLRNVSTDNVYIENVQEKKNNSSFFISYLSISFGYTSAIHPYYMSGRIARCYVR